MKTLFYNLGHARGIFGQIPLPWIDTGPISILNKLIMNMLRELVFRHWEAKLVSFILASAIWAILKYSINPGYMDQILTGTLPR